MYYEKGQRTRRKTHVHIRILAFDNSPARKVAFYAEILLLGLQSKVFVGREDNIILRSIIGGNSSRLGFLRGCSELVVESIDEVADNLMRILLLIPMEPIGESIDRLFELLGIGELVLLSAVGLASTLCGGLASCLGRGFGRPEHSEVRGSSTERIGERQLGLGAVIMTGIVLGVDAIASRQKVGSEARDREERLERGIEVAVCSEGRVGITKM